MNIILKKFLIKLSLLAFLVTFFMSFYVGTSLLHCFLRGSVSMVVIGMVGCFAMKGVFRDIALELAEYEAREKETDKKEKQDSTDQDESQFHDDEDINQLTNMDNDENNSEQKSLEGENRGD